MNFQLQTQYFDIFERSLIAKLRCGILKLHIETGRYNHISLENRICNNNQIEDEFHLLCICPLYTSQRIILYNAISLMDQDVRKRTDEDKFVYIMMYGYSALKKYLPSVWDIRTNHMYSHIIE